MSKEITTTLKISIWKFKFFTPDKYLFVVAVNGEPQKAIEVE
jgi:hypothetical protein